MQKPTRTLVGAIRREELSLLWTGPWKDKHLNLLELSTWKETASGDFPGGAVVKNLPANAGDTGSIPGPGRSHMLQSN